MAKAPDGIIVMNKTLHPSSFIPAGFTMVAASGQRVFHLGDGRWWDQNKLYWRNGQGRRVKRPSGDILSDGAWTPVVLACAHLNHDPSEQIKLLMAFSGEHGWTPPPWQNG